jgi:hypothetical protein
MSERKKATGKKRGSLTSTWNHRSVFDSILDSTNSITNGILDLSSDMLMWTFFLLKKKKHTMRKKKKIVLSTSSLTLDQNGTTERILDTFDECEFLLTQDVFVYQFSLAQAIGSQIVDTVHGNTAASQCQTFHVSSFGSMCMYAYESRK